MAGIPEYRLPREVVSNEVELIRSLGVEIKTGVTVGRDVTLDELRQQGYEAFFLGIGAHLGYKLKIEGENDFPQVYDVISFLRQVNLGNKAPALGSGGDHRRRQCRHGCGPHLRAPGLPRSPRLLPPHLQRDAGPPRRDGTGPGGRGADSFSDGAHQDRRRAGPVQYLECLQAELGRPDACGRRRPFRCRTATSGSTWAR